MGHNHFSATPSAPYGVVLVMASVAYLVLQKTIIASEGSASVLQADVGGDWKGKLSALLNLVAIASTFLVEWLAQAMFWWHCSGWFRTVALNARSSTPSAEASAERRTSLGLSRIPPLGKAPTRLQEEPVAAHGP